VGVMPPDSGNALIERLASSQQGGDAASFATLWWALRGDTASLRRQHRRLTEAQSRVPPNFRNMVRFQAAAHEAYLALARRDTATALTRFAALPDSLCPFCWLPSLTRAQLLSARGQNREAAAVLNHEIPAAGDPRSLFWQLERGRVNERLGNRAEALSAYRRVATLWSKADAELRVYAEEARAGMERLSGESVQ